MTGLNIEFIELLSAILAATLLLLSLIVSQKWGGLEEKKTSFAFLTATILSWVLDNNYREIQLGVFAIDICLMLYLFSIALTSKRFWPMYATSFQLVTTVVHAANLTDSLGARVAYSFGLLFWSYVVIVTMIAGTIIEARPRRPQR